MRQLFENRFSTRQVTPSGVETSRQSVLFERRVVYPLGIIGPTAGKEHSKRLRYPLSLLNMQAMRLTFNGNKPSVR